MFTGVYEIAGQAVQIDTVCERTHRSCRHYRAQWLEPRIFISTSQVDMEEEKVLLGKVPKTANTRFAENYLEYLAVQRKRSLELLSHDVLLFHGSALAVDNQAYIFTAPSGTGKSTHARLWREMLGDRVVMVNDDKPFIRITPEGAQVYGSPWNGKHHLSTNTHVPLRAICILERDVTNHIQEIRPEEAFDTFFHQAFIPREPQLRLKALSLLDLLCQHIRIYRLGCNMDPQAAQVSFEGMVEGKL